MGNINKTKRDQIMRELGHQERVAGTEYIRTGLDIYHRGMGITKELYPAIARAHGTEPSRVERAIRHSISSAWMRSSGEAAARYFSDDMNGAWPTNGEYFAVMARLLHETESAE